MITKVIFQNTRCIGKILFYNFLSFLEKALQLKPCRILKSGTIAIFLKKKKFGIMNSELTDCGEIFKMYII